MAETLARQPQDLQAWLLKTSILDRFCAPLCEAVCVQADGVRADSQAESSIRGDGFVTWLNERNLFVISLDHRGHWYRYHHLFQNLLQGRLEHALSPDEIAHLHTRASHWFLAQGLLDEAFEHALKGGDIETAVKIVVDHRHAEHDADRWHVVERWLDQLPGDVKAQHPALLLAQAWTDYQRFQMERIPAFVEQAGVLLDDHFPDPTVLGDLNYFRGNLQYWQAEGESSVRSLEAALAQVAGRQRQVEYNVELSLALARTMTGQKETAIEALNDRIRTAGAINGQFLTHLLGGLAIVRLICGELPQARVQAQRLHAEAARRNLTNNMAWSLYLHGVTLLHTFDLEQALEYFAPAIEHRYSMMRGGAIDTLAAMALTQHLLRREADAAKSVEWLLELAHETDGPHALAVARSCQARLALLRGDTDAAIQWASSARETAAPPTLFLWVEIPAITLARVHIAAGTEQSLKEASQLLNDVRRQSEDRHFACQTIEIAVLQAIALERQGRTAEALIVTEDALALAAPGGWIRPFVEAGEPMAGLLNQLRSQPVAPDLAIQLVRILSADPAQVMSAGQSRVVEPLTGRELQVLALAVHRSQHRLRSRRS